MGDVFPKPKTVLLVVKTTDMMDRYLSTTWLR